MLFHWLIYLLILIHIFLDDLDEVGQVQCSDLWVVKLGGRAERVGNIARISKALNKLEPWEDPRRWYLKETMTGPLAVS